MLSPCSPLFIVWLNAINIIEIDASLKTQAPSEADGYINFNIGSAKTIKPIAHGIIIRIDINTEKDNLLFVVSKSFCATECEIAGNNAVESAIFIAIGKFTKSYYRIERIASSW